MSEARERILDRLRANRPRTVTAPAIYQKTLGWNREQRISSFIERMQAVRGEVHRVDRGHWVDWINREIPARGLTKALVGRSKIAQQFASAADSAFELSRYDRKIEDWKNSLFHNIDFSITGTVGALAESGSLVLWPSPDEPRLMSLVPPLHIALVEVDHLYDNFAQMIQQEDWSAGMPTNALLISGPSKTADIEQTLAYGIHGPKELITLLLE